MRISYEIFIRISRTPSHELIVKPLRPTRPDIQSLIVQRYECDRERL